jgi:hypothetical protein
MRTIKVFFAVLAIASIGETAFNVDAMAAQVTRINENKGLIVIDGHKDEGFLMGAIVCFYAASGEEITCGRIQQTSEFYVTVKVSNRKAKQIRYGMEATLLDGSPEKKDAVEEQNCVDDSDCGDDGYCVNGKCNKTKLW